MKKKLQTLSDLATKEGPIYQRFQLVLEEWKVAYKKRKMNGDINVIKFLEHFGELS